jgi:DNA polymerase III subunit delta'
MELKMETQKALNWQVSGHVNQLRLLDRVIQGKTLAHAYVFSGPQRVGKRTVARRLAQFLLCQDGTGCGECPHCKTMAAGSNADYLEISIDEAIKIEHVRDLSYKLSLKPYAGNHKVAVIDSAHNLTTEAANALLKVLEEPKPHTLMILVTDNANRLLPTINSRAQKISFGPLAENELPEALRLSSAATEEDAQAFGNFNSGSLGQKLLLAAELAEKETSDLKSLLDYWLHSLEKILRENPEGGIAARIRGVMRAQRQLDQNVNAKLLLSELMVATSQ